MVENSNEPVVVNAFMLKMLHPLKPSINEMKAIVQKLQDQNKIYEAGVVAVFLGYMLGVHSLILETKSYILYPDKVSQPEIGTIDLICNQINRCSAMQKDYGLHSEQGITVNYELALQKLEALKDLFKAEQPDRTALSDVIVDLIYVTLEACDRLMNDLSLKIKDRVAEEEAKSEPVSDKQ